MEVGSVKIGLLLGVKRVVTTFHLKKLVVGPLFDQGALLHHQDQIGSPDCGEPVGDEEDSGSLKRFFEVDAHLTFREVIEGTRGLIENQKLGRWSTARAMAIRWR